MEKQIATLRAKLEQAESFENHIAMQYVKDKIDSQTWFNVKDDLRNTICCLAGNLEMLLRKQRGEI